MGLGGSALTASREEGRCAEATGGPVGRAGIGISFLADGLGRVAAGTAGVLEAEVEAGASGGCTTATFHWKGVVLGASVTFARNDVARNRAKPCMQAEMIQPLSRRWANSLFPTTG